MKKVILTILAMASVTCMSFGQGNVSLATALVISTNNGVNTGATATTAKNYFYAVLTSTYGGPAPTAITATGGASQLSTWTWAGVMGTNSTLTKGQIGSPATQTTTGNTWGAPTGGAYTTGTIMYYNIIGWSSNEGTDWLTISNSIATGNWAVPSSAGFFGASAVAFNYSGGGPSSLATINVWASSGASGLAGSGGLTAFQLTPVPEPATFALAGLGGLALLLIRRRK